MANLVLMAKASGVDSIAVFRYVGTPEANKLKERDWDCQKFHSMPFQNWTPVLEKCGLLKSAGIRALILSLRNIQQFAQSTSLMMILWTIQNVH